MRFKYQFETETRIDETKNLNYGDISFSPSFKSQLTKINILLQSPTQLISESHNNSHNRVKITPQDGVTIFGVNITRKRSYFFLWWS